MSDELIGHDSEERVELLSIALMEAIGKDYRDHAPPNPENVLVVLHALAVATATVLVGTGPDPEAAEFFARALGVAMADLQEEGDDYDA